MMKSRALLFFVLFFALVLGAALALGQAANQATTQANQASATPGAAADPVMPKDPNALMQLAARVNGLASPDMKPWHLKANYQTFDADGKPKDTGVFEEWWVGPEKYKRSYSSSNFNQTLYWNGGKGWITGDPGWPPPPQEMVKQYLVHPLPDVSDVAKRKYFAVDQKMGQVTLKCLKQQLAPRFSDGESSGEPAGAWSSSVCLAKEWPIMRFEDPEMNVFVFFNEILRLNGQYVAKQIAVEDAKVPIVNVSVAELEGLSQVDSAEFVPPASAVPAPVEGGEEGVIPGHKISGKDIEFPQSAKEKRIQGTVMLDMIITKTGSVTDLQVVSGPRELRQAAVDGVKTWRFQPFTLNGTPVDARVSRNVTFSMW
jgi:TonB family protein